ncbi:MAG TPA: hypothetical protein VGH82_16940 [Gaiellaceae bacterium]|jgi:hypothetical protein
MDDHAHPLFGASLRADRAEKYLDELHGQLTKWTEEHVNVIGFSLNPETGEPQVTQTAELPMPILYTASAIIGDAVANLRAALDYTVYQLAKAGNGGKHVRGTQFPVEDDEDDFWARVSGLNARTGKRSRRYLRHVPNAAVLRIFQLQPCASVPCRWTKRLIELSNPDKHQNLTGLKSEASINLKFRQGEETDDGMTIRVEGNIELAVEFEDAGDDVFSTLREIHGRVRGVIDVFSPTFERITE